MGQKAEAVRAVLRPLRRTSATNLVRENADFGWAGRDAAKNTTLPALIDTLGGTDTVSPELSALLGVEDCRHLPISTCRAHACRLAATIELDARARAVSRRAADAVADLLSEPLTYELTAGSRVGSERCSTTSPATDPRRHAGRPGQHSSPMKRREVASQRRAGIAGRLECSTSPSDHAGHPVKAGPGVWAASQGSVRGDYQAATGGPWA